MKKITTLISNAKLDHNIVNTLKSKLNNVNWLMTKILLFNFSFYRIDVLCKNDWIKEEKSCFDFDIESAVFRMFVILLLIALQNPFKNFHSKKIQLL